MGALMSGACPLVDAAGNQNNAHPEHVLCRKAILSRGVLQVTIPVLRTPPLTLTAKLRANLSTYYFGSS